jgi:hypothetical protein
MDQITFNQVVSRECGIDVHKKVVVATVNGEGLKKTHTGVLYFHEFFD